MPRLMHPGFRTPHRERGFAMIVIISLIVLVSAYLIANVLSRTGAELSNERGRRSMDALRQAKAALIAYAASEQWQAYKGQVTNQPGGLPCPDLNNDGTSAGLCSNALSRVGRLPWATIGADDLRDASGERLWYAVSSNFRKLSGTTIINSDTQGLLTVTGNAPASNVVAIVFAPGPAIQDSTLPGQIQDRRAPNINRLASYLECFTPGANDYSFTSNYTVTTISPLPTCASSVLSPDMFNDRLLVITQADLMAAVEPAVVARIQRDIQPYFDAYKAAWGRYPFAVPFMNPGTTTDNYKGAAGKYSGLLPIGLVTVKWNTNYGAANSDPNKITLNPSTPPGTSGSGDCSSAAGTTTSMVQCTITYSCTLSPTVCPTATLTATANVGDGLVAPTPPGAINVLPSSGIASVTSSTWSQLNNNSDNATITVNITMGSSAFPSGTVTVQVPAPAPDATTNPVYDATVNPNSSNAYWFVSNQWYRQVFYAVAPAFAPGGGGDCHAMSPCLTVNNLPGSPANAILILAGRSLSSNPSRPNATLSDYLEGLNFSAVNGPTTIFEHRAGMPTLINDRVVVISP